MTKGQLVPDEIIISLVEQRIKQSDCRVNGWTLDGFPKTVAQITLLKSLKLKPSIVVVLECSEDTCINRLKDKRIDPQTGIFYDMNKNPPKEDSVQKRLVMHEEDEELVVRRRYTNWTEFVGKLEEAYKTMLLNVNAEGEATELTNTICEAIQNPIF